MHGKLKVEVDPAARLTRTRKHTATKRVAPLHQLSHEVGAPTAGGRHPRRCRLLGAGRGRRLDADRQPEEPGDQADRQLRRDRLQQRRPPQAPDPGARERGARRDPAGGHGRHRLPPRAQREEHGHGREHGAALPVRRAGEGWLARHDMGAPQLPGVQAGDLAIVVVVDRLIIRRAQDSQLPPAMKVCFGLLPPSYKLLASPTIYVLEQALRVCFFVAL